MLYVNIIPLQQSFVLHSSSDPVTLSSRLVLFFFFRSVVVNDINPTYALLFSFI